MELRTRSASCCHSFPLLPTGTLTLQSETAKQNIINILLINRSIHAVTELGSRFTHSVFKMCMPLSLMMQPLMSMSKDLFAAWKMKATLYILYIIYIYQSL